MDFLDFLTSFLLNLVPAVAAVAVVYIMMTKYFENEQLNRQKEWAEKKVKQHLPVQMQAYERLVLLMERINPESLVFRVNKPGMSARLLQADILKVIRDEFDHNLTQQLYISSEAWASVKAAREETVNILKVAASRVGKDADSFEFATAILEVVGQLEKLPTDIAIDILKREFRSKLKA